MLWLMASYKNHLDPLFLLRARKMLVSEELVEYILQAENHTMLSCLFSWPWSLGSSAHKLNSWSFGVQFFLCLCCISLLTSCGYASWSLEDLSISLQVYVHKIMKKIIRNIDIHCRSIALFEF